MKLDLPKAGEAVRHTMAEAKMPVVLVEMGDNIGDESTGARTAVHEDLPMHDAHGLGSVMFDSKTLGTGMGCHRCLTGKTPTAV